MSVDIPLPANELSDGSPAVRRMYVSSSRIAESVDALAVAPQREEDASDLVPG